MSQQLLEGLPRIVVEIFMLQSGYILIILSQAHRHGRILICSTH